MRLTRHGDYAVRVVVDLASRPAGRRLARPCRVGHQPPGRDRGRRGPARAQPLRRRRRRVPARPRVPGASRLGQAAAPARARARGGQHGRARGRRAPRLQGGIRRPMFLSWLPENVSTFGRDIDGIIALIYYITLAWFIATMGTFAVFLVRYRRRARPPPRPPNGGPAGGGGGGGPPRPA